MVENPAAGLLDVCPDGHKCIVTIVNGMPVCRHGLCLKNGKAVCPAKLLEEHVKRVWRYYWEKRKVSIFRKGARR